jgi:hypothetical protein
MKRRRGGRGGRGGRGEEQKKRSVEIKLQKLKKEGKIQTPERKRRY